jgi:hypothetical protein
MTHKKLMTPKNGLKTQEITEKKHIKIWFIFLCTNTKIYPSSIHY